MANDKLNKELVSRMMDDAAWKELSKDFPWTEQLLEKYMNYVDWKEFYTFADVTCKGVTFRLAKGSHLDSRAQRYCNKI